MAKSTTKGSTSKALTKWDEELAKRANIQAEVEANVGAGGQFLSTRGGILMYKNNPVPDNKMNVVILNHVMENALYEGRFDADNPASPVCFAFGDNDKTIAPHEKAEDRKADICKDCEFNEWGSADTGDGKACKNIRRLSIMTEDGLEDVEAAETAMIKVPVTSVKAWAGYVKQLKETLKRPTCAVITEISLVKDAKTQFKMQFKLVSKIDGDVIGDLLAKADEALKELTQPYTKREEGESEAPRGKTRGKASASRAVARGARRR
jgi:hypothetical protein